MAHAYDKDYNPLLIQGQHRWDADRKSGDGSTETGQPVMFKRGDPSLLRTDEYRDNHDPTLIDRRSMSNTGRLTTGSYRRGPSLKQEAIGPSCISRTAVTYKQDMADLDSRSR